MNIAQHQQLPDPDTLVAALLTMMTRFSCLGCPRLAGRIRRHLALLRHYADDEMPPLLKKLAARLEGEWAQLHQALADTDDGDAANDPSDLHSARPDSPSLH